MNVYRKALAEGTTGQGWLAVEGPFLVEEALAAAPQVQTHSVLLANGAVDKFSSLSARLPTMAEVRTVPDRLFERIAQTETPQGIAALVELPRRELEPLLADGRALLLAAFGVQDPGNLGTMMRSAWAFGASALLTFRDTVSPFNPKAVRASAGAIFRLPVIYGLEPSKSIHLLRRRMRLVAADRHSPSPLWLADLTGPLAILIGREATGLPNEIARQASQLLSIPIGKDVDSVNAAIAASIFLYEAARQRGLRH